MQSSDDNPKLYQEAVDAFAKHCKKNGLIYLQPNATDSEIGRKYVHLRNVNGPLAKYDIQNKVIIAG